MPESNKPGARRERDLSRSRAKYVVYVTHQSDGQLLHTSYYGPFTGLVDASATADSLDELYRERAFKVDGVECASEAYTVTLMDPPRFSA